LQHGLAWDNLAWSRCQTQIGKEREMSYEIEIKEVKSQPVMSIRTQCHAAEIGPILQEILPEVWAHVTKLGGTPAGPPFTRYHGFSENRVDLEGGIPVEKHVTAEGRVEASELPGGKVATTIHTGPYEKLPDAHDALHVWIEKNGKEPAGPQWEYYRTDPGQEPDPNKRQTELLWPIRG
jgi:effector-binding domain-containing protein